MVHIILFSIILVSFLCRKQGKILQAVPFILLFVFAAIRYGFGNDYFSYLEMYNRIHAGSIWDEEYLFAILNRVMPSFYLLIAVISFVFVFTIYKLIDTKVSKEYAWLSLFIFIISPYLFLMNLSAIRQCLAMVVFIWAIPFARRKNYIMYFLCVIMAALFHKSALILLPVCLVISEKPVNNIKIIGIFALTGLILASGSIPQYAERIISAWFQDANYLASANNGMTNSVRATLLSSIYMIYVALNIKKLRGDALVYSKLYLIGAVLGVVAFKLSALTRIQMYFDIFAVISLPSVFQCTLERGDIIIGKNNIVVTIWEILNKYALPVLILLIYLLRYYSFFTNPMWRSFTEYETIFSAVM